MSVFLFLLCVGLFDCVSVFISDVSLALFSPLCFSSFLVNLLVCASVSLKYLCLYCDPLVYCLLGLFVSTSVYLSFILSVCFCLFHRMFESMSLCISGVSSTLNLLCSFSVFILFAECLCRKLYYSQEILRKFQKFFEMQT